MLLLLAALAGDPVPLDPVLVAASRAEPAPQDEAVASDIFGPEELQQFDSVTLDDTLRDDPSFSLFRRTTSLISNPTSQGVSLRGIGPSGASRSLVVLDGVPLNDPFGGWVVWTQIPRLLLGKVDILQGGGSGIWGSAALAGTIELIDTPPAAGDGIAQAEAGAFSTYDGEVAQSVRAGDGKVTVDADGFRTAGFYDLLPQNRGAVDRPLGSDHQLGEIVVEEPLGPAVQAVVTGRMFAEDRGNGTALQNNTTHLAVISAAIEGRTGDDFSWNTTGYVERESFSAFFSAVSADRSSETPSDDQFDVPATAAGGAFTARWASPRAGVTEAGADFRQVVGETREDLSYSQGEFIQVRFAGGEQDFGGIFLHHEQPFAPGWTLDADARADSWQNRQGHSREYSLQTGAPTQVAEYPTQTGDAFSPNAGIVYRPNSRWRFHAAAYHGFRLPTLNEYYRPYRVGNVTTDANPNLQAETLDGAEAGAELTSGKFTLSATGFTDELYRSVGTVVVSENAAGETVERANLDEVQVRGLEASALWRPVGAFDLRLGELCNETLVQRASAEPDLQGLRLPEVPRNTVTAEATWRAPWGLVADGRLRWVSLQFDDPQNTLRLPAAGIADVQLSRRFGRRLNVYVAMENAGNALIATSETTTGLYTYDAPRLLRAGARFDW